MPKPLQLLALILLATTATAQTTLRATTTLVQVPTLVRTASGELIHTLGPSDFRLLDNGIPQQLTLEPDTRDRRPTSLLVLMQTGGAAIRQFPNYAGVGTMLETLTGSSPCRAAVVSFDSRPEDVWSFAPNFSGLREAFTRPTPGDSGAALYDAMDVAIGLLEKEPASSQRILLLLTQENDAGSKLREQNILSRLGQSDIMVLSLTFSPEKTWLKDQFTHERQENPPYQFGPDRTLAYTFNLDVPLRNALQGMRANAAAQLATLSGGEALPFANRQDLERQLALLANHIPNRYLLTFRPTTPTPGLHTLTVSTPTHPTARISARTTYWLTPTSPN